MFVARRPFLHNGHTYKIGEVIKGFPTGFNRDESFIRTGLIVEKPDKAVRKPKVMEEIKAE